MFVGVQVLYALYPASQENDAEQAASKCEGREGRAPAETETVPEETKQTKK